MSSKEILVSNLLEPGAMFKVTEDVKDSTFSPGSLGFVSYIKGTDESYQNVAKIVTVMIRRGKSGKPRVMNAVICVPVFYVDHKGFKKLLPEEGNKKYYMQIEREIPMAIDLMSLNSLEFLGYAVAMSKRVRNMSEQCKHKKWPESNSHPINFLKKLPDNFEGDADAYLMKADDIAFRTEFVEETRRMISSLVRVQLQMDIVQAETEINAAEFLLFTNKGEFIPKDAEDKTNEYEFAKDNDMLVRTLEHHKKIRDNITNLYHNKKTKSS